MKATELRKLFRWPSIMSSDIIILTLLVLLSLVHGKLSCDFNIAEEILFIYSSLSFPFENLKSNLKFKTFCFNHLVTKLVILMQMCIQFKVNRECRKEPEGSSIKGLVSEKLERRCDPGPNAALHYMASLPAPLTPLVTCPTARALCLHHSIALWLGKYTGLQIFYDLN